MFDVGFSELLVVGVVALIVIGPERLPAVARTAGVLLGRLQRYVNSVKADISREIQLDELKKLQQQVAEQARSMETAVSTEVKAVETSLQEIEQPFAATTGTVPAAPVPAQTPEEMTQMPAQQLELGLGAIEDKHGKG